MSPSFAKNLLYIGSFPRVSGDEPELGLVDKKVPEFSPRERG